MSGEEPRPPEIRHRLMQVPSTGKNVDVEQGVDNRNTMHLLAKKKENYRQSVVATLVKKIAKGKRDLTRMNSPRNCWKSKMHWFLFCANLGNDVTIFPITMRLALSLSAGAFILILFLSSILLVMPMIYSEIFLGRYSKLSNSQMYKIVPFSFGFSIVIFIVNILYYPVTIARVSQYLSAVLKLFISSRLFINCPPSSERITCYDYKINGPLKQLNCTYKYMSVLCNDGNEYRYPVQYIYWWTLKDMGENYPMWQFVISIIVSWFVITTLSMLGMKALGLVLKIFYIIYMLLYSVIFLMALTTQGAVDGLELLVEVKFQNIKFVEVFMLLSFSFRKFGLVVPTGYMTYSAYTQFSRFGPSAEALIMILLNILQTIYLLGLFYSIAGILSKNVGIPIDATIVPYEGMYVAMLTEFLVFKQCPKLFIIAYYLISWILEIIKIAIAKNWLIMNIYDYYPQIRNFESYVRIAMGCIFCILTLIAATQIFSVIYIPLFFSGHTVVAVSLEMFIQSTLVFYCYGVNRLSDDIQFVSGKRPIRYWRIMWYLLPIICIVQLCSLIFNYHYNIEMDKDILYRKNGLNILTVGALVCLVIIILSLVISFLYIMFTFQQSKIAVNVLKPQFLWGPPKTEMRVARKLFAPRTAIRSQSNRKHKQRFRKHSIKQMREKDLAENVKRGRIFLDNMFFSDITIATRKLEVVTDNSTPQSGNN